MDKKQDFLKDSLFLYPQKPAMALWRASELAKANSVIQKIEIKGPSIDIGCGDGEIAKILFKDKTFDIGLDISYLEVDKAKKSEKYVRTIVSDIYDNRLENEFFGFVFSNSVIEHLEFLEKGLKEIARITEKGGLFVLTVPADGIVRNTFLYKTLQNTRFKKLAVRYGEKRNHRLGHFLARSAEDWKKALENQDFKVTSEMSYLSPETTRVWDVLSYFDFLLRATFLDRIIMKFPKAVKNVLAEFWLLFLKKVYEKETLKNFDDGSCLLITAEKV